MGGATPAPGPGKSLQSYLPTAAGPQANTGAPNSGGAPMGGATPYPLPPNTGAPNGNQLANSGARIPTNAAAAYLQRLQGAGAGAPPINPAINSGGAPMGGATPAPGPGQSLQSYLPTAAGPQANTGAPMGGKTPAPGPGQSLMGGATPAPGPGQSLPSQPIHPALAAALARIHQGMGGGGIRPF